MRWESLVRYALASLISSRESIIVENVDCKIILLINLMIDWCVTLAVLISGMYQDMGTRK